MRCSSVWTTAWRSSALDKSTASLRAARALLSQAQKLPQQQQIKRAEQRAVIDAVQHRIDGARTVLARKRRQAEKEVLSPTEVDAAESLVHELEAQYQVETGKLRELELIDPDAGVRQAQAEVDAKEAQLNEARTAAEEYVLKAPADGTVLRVMVGRGDIVGAQAKQPAVIFCPGGQRVVRAEVEQEFARGLAIGQVASIRDDSTGEGNWTGPRHSHFRLVHPAPFSDAGSVAIQRRSDARMHHRAGRGPTRSAHRPTSPGYTAARRRLAVTLSGRLVRRSSRRQLCAWLRTA